MEETVAAYLPPTHTNTDTLHYTHKRVKGSPPASHDRSDDIIALSKCQSKEADLEDALITLETRQTLALMVVIS